MVVYCQNIIQFKNRAASLFLMLFLLSTTTFNSYAKDNVEFQADGPTKVILDKPFQISFNVNANGKDLRLPEIENFDILAGPFTSHSTSKSYVNGVSTTNVSQKYTYTLLAKRIGNFSIPPASIVVKDKKHYSKGLSIEVLPAEEEEKTENSNARTDAKKPSEQTKLSNENLFIRTIVSKTKAFEQEAIQISYRLYSTLDIVNFSHKKLPEFKGFLKNEIEFQPQLSLENYNGRNYTTVDLYQTVLFPQHSGKFVIDAASFDIIIRIENTNKQRSIFDSFFDSYSNLTKTVKAPSTEINVSPLPTKNKPTNFSGAVGTFDIHSSLSAKEIKENEALTMKIIIEGEGNLRMIKTPEIKLPDSFEQYDPKSTNDFKVSKTGLKGKRTVEYLFIPRHSGEFEIPAVSFSYFDLKTKEYKTVATPNYNLNILKGDKENHRTPIVENDDVKKEQIKELGKDIRYIYTQGFALQKENKKEKVGSLLSFFIFLTPLLFAFLIFVALRKNNKDKANVLLLKNKKANKLARKRLKSANKLLLAGEKGLFYNEVLKAIWVYLSDKLSISAAMLTRDNAAEKLRERNVDEETISELTAILDSCEFARYAPNSGQEEMGNLYEDSIELISKLEEKIKKK